MLCNRHVLWCGLVGQRETFWCLSSLGEEEGGLKAWCFHIQGFRSLMYIPALWACRKCIITTVSAIVKKNFSRPRGLEDHIVKWCNFGINQLTVKLPWHISVVARSTGKYINWYFLPYGLDNRVLEMRFDLCDQPSSRVLLPVISFSVRTWMMKQNLHVVSFSLLSKNTAR